MRFAPYFVVALLLGPMLEARAQNASTPAPGERVKVWLRSCYQAPPTDSRCEVVTGKVVRSGGDTLVVLPDDVAANARIPWYTPRFQRLDLRQVHRIQISRGRKAHALEGLGWGMIAGGVLAGGIASAACEDGLFTRDACIEIAVLFAGIPVGGLSGLIVGAFMRSERWRDVSAGHSPIGRVPNSVAITPSYSRGAVGLNARITF